ncbi:carbohydrate ABC transporter permease [Devosia ginsengisoli]|uniref:Sugar ABC transporter permease n=1 Tax=Devosia ginsengisoli TaxID=400770 RepID=A0A5B8LS04_9HYPH|nr:sugar ABC transporter permease [Devosia ginsengisoli]QDZ10669.1 sugar ABC transporter permease [Devosia ginsengisoli]
MLSSIKRSNLLPLWLLGPVGLLLVVILIWPILQGIALSFYNTRILTYSEGRFIGFANFNALFQDEYFWNSFRVTAIYGIASVTATYALGLGFALLLNREFAGRGLIRTIFILPWAIPEVVAVLIFVWMLDPQFGVLNYVFTALGLISEPLPWLSQSHLALPALVALTAWQQFPLAMLILLAGLQMIPKEQYEAATIDGAGPVSRFFHVTLPGLRSVNIILVLLLTLNSFRRVTMIYAMTRGGPARSTETLSILTYNTAFEYQRIGYAAAVGTTLLMILLFFSVVYFWATRQGKDAR